MTPPLRMWLFGIFAIIEPYCSRKLEELFPDHSWIRHVTPARLQKTEALQAERGFLLADSISGVSLSFVERLAAGAMLTMIGLLIFSLYFLSLK